MSACLSLTSSGAECCWESETYKVTSKNSLHKTLRWTAFSLFLTHKTFLNVRLLSAATSSECCSLNNRTYIYAFTSGGIYHGLSPTDSWDRLQPSHDPEMVSKKIDGWIADFSSPSIVTSVRFLIYMWKFSSKRSYKTASRQ